MDKFQHLLNQATHTKANSQWLNNNERYTLLQRSTGGTYSSILVFKASKQLTYTQEKISGSRTIQHYHSVKFYTGTATTSTVYTHTSTQTWLNMECIRSIRRIMGIHLHKRSLRHSYCSRSKRRNSNLPNRLPKPLDGTLELNTLWTTDYNRKLSRLR